MLIFNDHVKRVRVIRVTTNAKGQPAREVLGAVPKRDMQIPPELLSVLSRDELDQLNKVLKVYQGTHASLVRYQAQCFPVIAREVMEYFETTADQTERELIAGAVQDALRRIRAAEREKLQAQAASGGDRKKPK